MFPTRVQCAKKNLLLCFDAFGTLFQPNVPIPKAYAEAAIRHGIKCDGSNAAADVGREFKRAFKEVSKRHPNYGKATGLGAEKWWRNVIKSTFTPWLEPGQTVPQPLVDDLVHRYSTKQGYDLFPDVLPLFQKLRTTSPTTTDTNPWPWKRTIVGIITNSDSRVPGILSSFGLKVSPRRVGTPDPRTADAALEDDVSFVVLSYDVGVEKPACGIFDAAVTLFEETAVARGEEADLKYWDMVYVGDSVEHDVVGAQRAGWKALRLDREGRGRAGSEDKDVRVVCERVEVGDGLCDVEVHTIRNLGALGALDPTRWPEE